MRTKLDKLDQKIYSLYASINKTMLSFGGSSQEAKESGLPLFPSIAAKARKKANKNKDLYHQYINIEQ